MSGKIYAATHAAPTPATLGVAVIYMGAAHTDAIGRRTTSNAYLNIKAGRIGGSTFTAGVYTWGTDINIDSDITIKGDKNSKFIFQSAGNIVAASGAPGSGVTVRESPPATPYHLRPTPSPIPPTP